MRSPKAGATTETEADELLEDLLEEQEQGAELMEVEQAAAHAPVPTMAAAGSGEGHAEAPSVGRLTGAEDAAVSRYANVCLSHLSYPPAIAICR